MGCIESKAEVAYASSAPSVSKEAPAAPAPAGPEERRPSVRESNEAEAPRQRSKGEPQEGAEEDDLDWVVGATGTDPVSPAHALAGYAAAPETTPGKAVGPDVRVQIELEGGWRDCGNEETRQICEHLGRGDMGPFQMHARGQNYTIGFTGPDGGKQANSSTGKTRKLRVLDGGEEAAPEVEEHVKAGSSIHSVFTAMASFSRLLASLMLLSLSASALLDPEVSDSAALQADDECEASSSTCGLNALQLSSRDIKQQDSEELGVVDEMYTFGAPGTAKPAFTNLASADGIFIG
ncbi:unnamed protein product, partial [Polarella glacialis]